MKHELTSKKQLEGNKSMNNFQGALLKTDFLFYYCRGVSLIDRQENTSVGYYLRIPVSAKMELISSQ